MYVLVLSDSAVHCYINTDRSIWEILIHVPKLPVFPWGVEGIDCGFFF